MSTRAVNLPADLVDRAEAAALPTGDTLEDWIATAVERRLAGPQPVRPQGQTRESPHRIQ